MNTTVKTSIWNQYGAAIDTLDDAIGLCPDELWTAAIYDDEEDARFGQFWFLAYHTLRWLDLYLGGEYEGFEPPAPFLSGRLPDAPYSKADIRRYLHDLRARCRSVIMGLTDEQAARVCTFPWMEPTFLELQLYTMRHIMEHAAQLNLMLGHHGVTGQDWVAQARDG